MYITSIVLFSLTYLFNLLVYYISIDFVFLCVCVSVSECVNVNFSSHSILFLVVVVVVVVYRCVLLTSVVQKLTFFYGYFLSAHLNTVVFFSCLFLVQIYNKCLVLQSQQNINSRFYFWFLIFGKTWSSKKIASNIICFSLV